MAHTAVGNVGAGPAGLVLAHLLHPEDIGSVVLEYVCASEGAATTRAEIYGGLPW